MEITTIIFPTDFSEGSSSAAAHAADLALKYGATVVVLHVIYDIARDSVWYGSHLNLDNLYSDVRGSAEAELDLIIREQFAGLPSVEKALIVGMPYEGIISTAKDRNADLIVMGTHGRKGIDRVIFGSTAHKVVRHSPCPVLTVRKPG